MARRAADLIETDRSHDLWPPLPYAVSKDTQHAVHMWTQVVGKFVLALTPRGLRTR